MSEKKQSSNQGEGNRQAARNYNESTQTFVESQDIEQKARQAAPRDEKEQEELNRAEQEGKKHAKEVDPAVARDHSKATRANES